MAYGHPFPIHLVKPTRRAGFSAIVHFQALYKNVATLPLVHLSVIINVLIYSRNAFAPSDMAGLQPPDCGAFLASIVPRFRA